MVDFLLDTQGDIKLTKGKITLTDDVGQAIRVRLKTFKGEWFLNINHGIPYFQSILGKKTTKQKIDSIFKKEIASVKNVLKIISYKSLVLDRVYQYEVIVETKKNEIILVEDQV